MVSTLGLPLFQITRQDTLDHYSKDQTFSISRKGIDGQGIYTEEGFVVLAGSKFSKSVTPSLAFAAIKKRNQLVEDKILFEKDEHLELKEDVVFNSPSHAGACVTGRSTNGWTEWKLQSGKTLSDVYRD